jgi:hypothetical protein
MGENLGNGSLFQSYMWFSRNTIQSTLGLPENCDQLWHQKTLRWLSKTGMSQQNMPGTGWEKMATGFRIINFILVIKVPVGCTNLYKYLANCQMSTFYQILDIIKRLPYLNEICQKIGQHAEWKTKYLKQSQCNKCFWCS